MSCDCEEDLTPSEEETKSDSVLKEHSVKNIASMFNQPNKGPGMGGPPLATKPKPSVGIKPGKLDLDNNFKIISPNVRSPLFEKPTNGSVKSPNNVPPKPAAKTNFGGPVMLGPNSADILNIKSQLKKPPVPRPPINSTPSEGIKVELKRSIKKRPVAPPRVTGLEKESPTSDGNGSETKENVSSSKSEGDCSSLSSFTSDSSIPRRGSEGSQKISGDKVPMLEPLPPLETIGPPPKKPAKPENVTLPQPEAPPPVVFSNKSSLHGKILPSVAAAEPADIEEDSGDIYDDVAATNDKRISLIPPMDSDEEQTTDDLYDDTEMVQPLPPLPSVQSLPTIQQTSGSDDVPQEIYDDVSVEGESDEIYEVLDTSTESSSTQKRPSIESGSLTEAAPSKKSSLPSGLSPKKSIMPSKSKQEEKQRKELEKQEQLRRKKEEELRKKREKEEKKRREKEEKDMKKKYNIKGDLRVLDTGTATQDLGSEYEKSDLICKRGERLQILRREGNPPGKWLARDTQARYGFVDADFVAVEADGQETYDDIIPCDDSGSEPEQDQEIYEAFD